MDEITFRNLNLNEFPSLREDLEEWEGLVHLQVSEFQRFTQSAIEEQSLEVVSKCFQIPSALLEGKEHLDFRTDAGKRAAQLMPRELKQGRDDILDYDEQFLGRK